MKIRTLVLLLLLFSGRSPVRAPRPMEIEIVAPSKLSGQSHVLGCLTTSFGAVVAVATEIGKRANNVLVLKKCAYGPAQDEWRPGKAWSVRLPRAAGDAAALVGIPEYVMGIYTASPTTRAGSVHYIKCPYGAAAPFTHRCGRSLAFGGRGPGPPPRTRYGLMGSGFVPLAPRWRL